MTTPPPAPHSPADPTGALAPRRWTALVVLCLGVMIISLDNTILNVALPTVGRDLGARASDLQWMVDAYLLVFAALLLTAGAVGDRYGRRRALLAGLVVFGVGSAAAAWASTPAHLIGVRAVMGIGAALIFPTTLSIITNLFTGSDRTTAIAAWSGVAGAGAVLGPVAGGVLIEVFSWEAVFLLNVPVVAAVVLGTLLVVPGGGGAAGPRLDLVGAALSIVALSALVYAVVEGPVLGVADPLVLVAVALALVTGTGFFVWEKRHPAPMLDLRVFRNRQFSTASGALTLTSFALIGSFFLLSQYLQFSLGYSALEAGVRTLPAAAGMALSFLVVTRLLRRLGRRTVLTGGLVLMAIAFAIWSVETVAADDLWRSLVLAGFTFGMGLVMTPATDAVMDALPAERAGVASAINDTTRELGGALGVAVLGSVAVAIYRSELEAALSPMPAPVREAALESAGQAALAADQLGGEAGRAVAQAAETAYFSGVSITYVVAAAATALSAAVVWRFMPAARQQLAATRST